MENRIHREVAGLIQNVRTMNGNSFEPRKFVSGAVLNVISSIVFGSHSDTPDAKTMRIFELVHRQMYETLELVGLDVWPVLRFLPTMRKALKNAAEISDELIALLNMKIDENLSPDTVENFSSCFVEDDPKGFDRVQLIYTMRDLIVAGTETSSTAVLWWLVLLANHPDIQERLQKEIDAVVPRDRLPSLDDKSKMAYVEVAILELMRIRTLVPLSLPHSTTCDTEVGGFFIPKRSMVCVKLI